VKYGYFISDYLIQHDPRHLKDRIEHYERDFQMSLGKEIMEGLRKVRPGDPDRILAVGPLRVQTVREGDRLHDHGIGEYTTLSVPIALAEYNEVRLTMPHFFSRPVPTLKEWVGVFPKMVKEGMKRLFRRRKNK